MFLISSSNNSQWALRWTEVLKEPCWLGSLWDRQSADKKVLQTFSTRGIFQTWLSVIKKKKLEIIFLFIDSESRKKLLMLIWPILAASRVKLKQKVVKLRKTPPRDWDTAMSPYMMEGPPTNGHINSFVLLLKTFTYFSVLEGNQKEDGSLPWLSPITQYNSLCLSSYPPITHMPTHPYTHVLSCIRLFATSWTVAHQAPLSMGSSRQEYWGGLPFPTPPNTHIQL